MSGDPKRLIDDPSIRADLREDLGVAVGVGVPTLDFDAGMRRLEAGLRQAGPAGSAGVGAGGAATGGAGLSIGAIGVVAALAAAATVGTGWMLTRGAGQAPTPSVSVERPAETRSLRAVPSEPRPLPIATSAPTEIELAPVPLTGAPTVDLPRRTPQGAESPTRPSEVTPEPTEPVLDSAHREIAELAQARSLLQSNPGAALELAQAGHREFRGGLLHQEREAVAIQALSKLGRASEAKSRASAFVRRYPESPYAAPVKRAGGLE